MATQATISRLPKDAIRLERYQRCSYCPDASAGVLVCDDARNNAPVCGPCSRLALAQRRVRA